MTGITGSLQVKHGGWYAVLNLKDENGKRHQKWISLNLPQKNNKRAAERKLHEILQEYNERHLVYDSNMKFYKLIELWLLSSKNKVRESTYKNYETVVNAHIIPYFKQLNIKARDLCPYHLEDYYRVKSETLSKETLSKHHSNIYSALEYGRKNHIINYNVAKEVTIHCSGRAKSATKRRE